MHTPSISTFSALSPVCLDTIVTFFFAGDERIQITCCWEEVRVVRMLPRKARHSYTTGGRRKTPPGIPCDVPNRRLFVELTLVFVSRVHASTAPIWEKQAAALCLLKKQELRQYRRRRTGAMRL